MKVLTVEPFKNLGTPAEIVKVFGGKPQYLAALRELEAEIYKVAQIVREDNVKVDILPHGFDFATQNLGERMLVREYEKKITKFSKRNVVLPVGRQVDISNPCGNENEEEK